MSPRQLLFTHHLTVKIRTRLKYKKIQYISEFIEESEDASIKLIYSKHSRGANENSMIMFNNNHPHYNLK